jgi:hypothetical protein
MTSSGLEVVVVVVGALLLASDSILRLKFEDVQQKI